MSDRRIILAGAAAIAMAVLFVSFKKEGTMPETSLTSSAEMTDFVPFDEDIAAIETAWSAPIPPDLQLIGGVDEIGFARVTQRSNAGVITFEGTFINAQLRYTGPLLFEHPQNKPVPDIKAGGYVLSHIDNGRLVVGQENTVPRDWFYLLPTQPQQIELAPAP